MDVLGSIFFLAIGVLCLIYGVYSSISTYRFSKSCFAALGTVLDHQEKWSWRTRYYVYTIEFQQNDGKYKTVKINSVIHFSPFIIRPSFEKGQSVPIWYDPRNPNRLTIGSITYLWFSSFIICVTGLLVSALGFVGLFR